MNKENITQKFPSPEEGASCLLPPMPVCPYCGTKPAKVISSPFKLGPLTLMTIFCAVCHKILSMFPVGMDQPEEAMVQPAGQPLVRLN